MSGLGRRSHYRKHLTDAVLNDFPEPASNERIAKIVSTRGSNQFDLIVAPKDGNIDHLTPQLAILPTKFRKLVWLKRNDYVICSCVDEEERIDKDMMNHNRNSKTSDGIKHMIEHILYKDQIKHLKEKGMWPTHELFLEGSDTSKTNEFSRNDTGEDHDEDDESESENDDGIIYEDEQTDEYYYCNMNRIAKLKVDDSSDDDSEEDN